MSWSIERKGQAKRVKELLQSDFSNIRKMSDPEETIKALAEKQIMAALDGVKPDMPVHVKAFGSWMIPASGQLGYGNFSVTFEPVYGFELNQEAL